ncbi:TRAP transporter large permease [Granulosicoccus antarcticus]|uniref:C4-dicarboxylate TRAP transporter large permease protein DctM n=1 Tax=Granulosicoccus antarcticus IMCC3135 TaxID=1192854 RepID=A0A2Z2NJW4_9GAMM|nr:TRAP transporter large permease subunit [Granulosicoccus antarcticus]ASJ70168.1 C4-dicarboxylate TRAP transporter large permease protein DctM [Granulosicoccus antarcticus IMCC3135]
MLFGLNGVEISLIITFACLFIGILSGFPVSFAIAGSAIFSFGIIALMSHAGLLYTLVENSNGTEMVPVLPQGWEGAFLSTLSTWSGGVYSRAFGGNVETLLAVPLFVLMGIALERSRIAEDLLTTMAKTFGSLPGGLAIAVVLVGTLLAASTGVVGATVVTMGLIALPTMLRAGYSKSLATGVIATSGTLGQIIPPSIVIVLLGSIVGDMYSIGQENRAKEMGQTVMQMLGEPAVLSTGTLFKAAFIPGVVLAMLYALYALGYALLKPESAPPIKIDEKDPNKFDVAAHYGHRTGLMVLLAVGPIMLLVALWIALNSMGIATAQELAADTGLVSNGTMAVSVAALFVLLLALVLQPQFRAFPVLVGVVGVVAYVLVDIFVLGPLDSAGTRFINYGVPVLLILYGVKAAVSRLTNIDVIRVVAPPVILIVSVLGSILGGITSPTPAAALGAAGAMMLAAARMSEGNRSATRIVLWASFAIVVMLLMRGNFDLRMTMDDISMEDQVAVWVTIVAYHVAIFGLLFSCFVLISKKVMSPIVQETTKVTSMVFMILIASLLLSLSVRAYGGEHYIQEVLKSIDDPHKLLLVVMAVLFILGFVLDFIEIIFIVIPIVGPVIYAADPALMPPEWITILIAVNLQTSFITPPFGFALFYLRGVAPPSVTTGDIYRGIWPFVIIQVIGLVILWNFPVITTFLPDLLPAN